MRVLLSEQISGRCHGGAATPDSPAPATGADVDLDTWYHVPAPRPGTVHVRSNFISSIDGAAELQGRSGGLGGSADRRVFRTLRWLADVVLVGAGTAVAEDYGPVIVPPERRRRRTAAGQAPVPPIAVVSGRLALAPSARLFSAPVRPILLTCARAPVDRRQPLAEVADIVICGEDSVELTAALHALAERGLGRVLCEGGPSLHADLAREGLLDELCLTFAPLLAGPEHVRIVGGDSWKAPVEMLLGHVLEEDGNLFLRYLRR